MKKKVSVAFMMAGLLFTVCLIVANIIEQKLINIGPIQATAGLIIFPISYIVNDLIAEVWGFRKARLIIWYGFLMNFVAIVAFKISIWMPSSEYFAHQVAFETVLGNTFRITFASFTAFLVGSFVNAYIMSKMKVMQKGKGFTLRAVVSTVFGQGFDSIVFFTLAFYAVMPNHELLILILTQTGMKTAYEILVLPLTTIIVKWVKKKEETDVIDYDVDYNPLKISDI